MLALCQVQIRVYPNHLGSPQQPPSATVFSTTVPFRGIKLQRRFTHVLLRPLERRPKFLFAETIPEYRFRYSITPRIPLPGSPRETYVTNFIGDTKLLHDFKTPIICALRELTYAYLYVSTTASCSPGEQRKLMRQETFRRRRPISIWLTIVGVFESRGCSLGMDAKQIAWCSHTRPILCTARKCDVFGASLRTIRPCPIFAFIADQRHRRGRRFMLEPNALAPPYFASFARLTRTREPEDIRGKSWARNARDKLLCYIKRAATSFFFDRTRRSRARRQGSTEV